MDSLRLLTRGSGLKVATKPEGHRPSFGAESSPVGDPDSQGKKRKRTDFEADINGSHQTLTNEDVRRIQKVHKIKITNMKALHSEHDSDSRKALKEASRLYPQPLQHFSALRNMNVNHSLLSNVSEQGYKEPTEVQLATIPLLMPGGDSEPDLLTVAPTGSGKTLAFMIPLIDKISQFHRDQDVEAPSRQVSAIILAPTKELVTQIVNEGRKLATRTGVRVTAFKKGMRLHEDVKDVGDEDSDVSEVEEPAKATIVKADILVSTPLSLLHAITPLGTDTKAESPLSLPQIQNLIFDEADVLLDPLFRSQTLALWSSCTSPSLRTSLWSATIGSNIEELALSTIKTRQKSLKLKSRHKPSFYRCIVGLKDSSLPNITHKLVYASTENGKLTGLRNLIRPPPTTTSSPKTRTEPLLRPPFMIFTQTIPRAQALHNELLYDIPASKDLNVLSRIQVLHSSLSSTQRAKIMANFRLGKIWILITTDLLSRGIDFRGINGVVNYDIPTTSASYVHRAGRTGRAGRKGGTCVTFYTKEDVMYLRPIVNVISKSQQLHTINNQDDDNGDVRQENVENQVPTWLMDALPHLTKNKKKELKERGVDIRRAAKESDDKRERRKKNRNLVGTKSGYEKKLEDRKRGMVEGSRRRTMKITDGAEENHIEEEDDFGGFD